MLNIGLLSIGVVDAAIVLLELGPKRSLFSFERKSGIGPTKSCRLLLGIQGILPDIGPDMFLAPKG